jgi:hypothetical protein
MVKNHELKLASEGTRDVIPSAYDKGETSVIEKFVPPAYDANEINVFKKIVPSYDLDTSTDSTAEASDSWQAAEENDWPQYSNPWTLPASLYFETERTPLAPVREGATPVAPVPPAVMLDPNTPIIPAIEWMNPPAPVPKGAKVRFVAVGTESQSIHYVEEDNAKADPLSTNPVSIQPESSAGQFIAPSADSNETSSKRPHRPISLAKSQTLEIRIRKAAAPWDKDIPASLPSRLRKMVEKPKRIAYAWSEDGNVPVFVSTETMTMKGNRVKGHRSLLLNRTRAHRWRLTNRAIQ